MIRSDAPRLDSTETTYWRVVAGPLSEIGALGTTVTGQVASPAFYRGGDCRVQFELLALPDARWDKMAYGLWDCEEFLRAIQ